MLQRLFTKWSAISIFILLFAIYFMKDGQPAEELIITTKQGQVRGKLSNNSVSYSFVGIPYGTVNGSNRFKAPYPPPKWEGIREPVLDITCPQSDSVLTEESEDCLVVNIYKPSTQHNKLIPVMVYIHGGAFQMGSPYSFEATPLVKHGVVLVSFTYRLGIYGFLCMGTKEIPGNAGMKDQVHALRWVRDNIQAFGGDPKRVTIFGTSAGAASVDLHVLSSMSKGLFHQAIMESGTSIAFWNVRQAGWLINETAKAFGKVFNNVEEIENILIETSVTQLQKVALEVVNAGHHILFSPCIENEFEDTESFLAESPKFILDNRKENKVSYMMGFSTRDGSIFLLPKPSEAIALAEKYFARLIPSDLKFGNPQDLEKVIKDVKQFYFNGSTMSLNRFVDFETDTAFLWPMAKRLMLQRLTSQKVFSFEFAYEGGLNINNFHPQLTDLKGACHSDEIGYLGYDHNNELLSPSPDDLKMVEILTTLWTNFAKYQNPTPETTDLFPFKWDTVQDMSDPNYLIIDVPLRKGLMSQQYKVRMAFWDKIYQKFYHK